MRRYNFDTKTQTKLLTSFQELISTPFQEETNAICWSRNLKGDFSEIVNKIDCSENMMIVEQDELRDLPLSEDGNLAREIFINVFQLLKEHGASPTLNIIDHYERDDACFFPTDVYSWHVDRSPIATDTFLCTYHGAVSEILPNSQAQQKILVPEIRTELRQFYDGEEDGFEAFLKEHFFDLHYQAKPNAQTINLGIGNLWKLAIDHPKSKVFPCVHRAPKENDGEKRLLMIC